MLTRSLKSSGRRARSRRAIALVSTCAALQLAGTVARGGSFSWNNSNGSWSNPGMWVNGSAPTGNDPTDVLNFGGFGFFAYTSVNDLPSPFRLNRINIASNFEFGPPRIEGAPLRFEGPQARIAETAGGLAIGNALQLTGPFFTVHLTNFGGLGGAISGTSTFIKTGPGYLTLSGNNTFVGTVAIGEGYVEVSSDSALGDPTNAVQLDGGALRIFGPGNSTRPYVINGAVSTISHSGATPANPLRLTGDFSGSGALVISAYTSTNAIELTGISTRTGGTVLAGGRLVVRNDSNLGGPPSPSRWAIPATGSCPNLSPLSRRR